MTYEEIEALRVEVEAAMRGKDRKRLEMALKALNAVILERKPIRREMGMERVKAEEVG